MLTAAQITAANAYLSDVAIAQWLTLIRSLPAYKDNPGLYPNLSTKLDSLKQGVIASSDQITAKILNGAMTQIESLGAGDVSLAGGSAAVNWSLNDNRNQFIMDGLNALYDVPTQRSSSAVVQMSGNTSICEIHRCGYSQCGCRRTLLVF